MLNKEPVKRNKINLYPLIGKYKSEIRSKVEAENDIKKVIESCYKTIFDSKYNWTKEQRVLIGKAYHDSLTGKYGLSLKFLKETLGTYQLKQNKKRVEANAIVITMLTNLIISFEQYEQEP